jgi:hypothetical protein
VAAISHRRLGVRRPLPVCPTRHTGRRNKMNELARWDATSKGLKPAFRDRNVTNGQPDGRRFLCAHNVLHWLIHRAVNNTISHRRPSAPLAPRQTNRISRRSSRISAPYLPCTLRACAMRCSPSGVRYQQHSPMVVSPNSTVILPSVSSTSAMGSGDGSVGVASAQRKL